MSGARLEEIIRAVVYEGHILYPYRPTAIKNRRRFTFGRVYPRAYAALQQNREAWTMSTECLVESESENPDVNVSVRFLQPVSRELEDPGGRRVPVLEIGARIYYDWQEVEERRVEPPAVMSGGSPHEHAFGFRPEERIEELFDGDAPAGRIRRIRALLAGRVVSSLERIEGTIHRLSVRLENRTLIPRPLLVRLQDRAAHHAEDELMLHTFVSAHMVLHVRNGGFVSMMDPPEALAGLAGACRNQGVWPVLVGDRALRDTLLCTPIILYDYPEIAPESAGDLFDATEIDELLTLRIQTLTEDEKREMQSVDVIARRLLERTESIREDELLQMHGASRAWNGRVHPPVGSQKPYSAKPPEHVTVAGRRVTVGDRVRIRPRAGNDVFDLALAGRTACVEAIEQDFEDNVYLALVIDDDPGRELGLMRQPGHRFFYGIDEVEPV